MAIISIALPKKASFLGRVDNGYDPADEAIE
jgi:hypothetical protein